jgi:hypothetical protein
MKKNELANIIITTILWALIIIGFQWVITKRITSMNTPDKAVNWSKGETMPSSNNGKIYLLEPFMNSQVAWDSEYYTGIAVAGYNDPAAGTAQNPVTGKKVIKNYSFFPFYPFMIRMFMLPLKFINITPIGAASLAGVIVSVLGTLAGLIALYDMTRTYFEEQDALRTVFYALIFPTSFFFAMVYTEGLFIGLAFGSIALAKRKHWLLASILALMASWTRAQGAAVALPLLVIWLAQVNWRAPLKEQIGWKWIAQGVFALLPLAGYLAWRLSPLGEGWAQLQEFFFWRGLMTFGSSVADWQRAINYALNEGGGNALIYMGIEIGSIGLALTASLWLLRRDLPLALFSLAVILLSVFSGSAQSMARYMLVTPALYIFLARLGKNKTFDYAWTTASILLLGMEAMLFAFDKWVG